MHEIETSRLRLRQLTMDDLHDLHYIYHHPALSQFMPNERPMSLVETRDAIDSIIENWQQYGFGVWAVVYKKFNKLIGHCGLKFLENTPEIQVGYLLLPSYWGMGLGTEAASAALKYGFDVIRLPKIVAIAKPNNIASRRVMEKVGMNYEKNAYYYDNDVVYYSISHDAFSASGWRFKVTIKQEPLSPPNLQSLTPVLR